MLQIPSRESLATLFDAAGAVVPALGVGFVRPDRDRVSLLFAHRNGFAEYVIAAADAPDLLRPSTDGPRQGDTTAIAPSRDGPVAWLLKRGGIRRVVSYGVPQGEDWEDREDRSIRFWVGISDPNPLTSHQIAGLEAVAVASVDAFTNRSSPDDAGFAGRFARTAELLPDFLNVLDVHQVFERLCLAARWALPHEQLTLSVFNEQLSEMTVLTKADGGVESTRSLGHALPAAVVRARAFEIVEDPRRYSHAVVPPIPPDWARSVLRLPIRFDDREVGSLDIVSAEPVKYTNADAVIGRRLADYVAIGLSHDALAEERRRTAILRQRAAALETLDGLLTTLTGVLDVREVFDRVSTIAQKVLPHDALSIAEVIDDGRGVRVHASVGLGNLPRPLDYPAPVPAMATEPWDFRLIDDVRQFPPFARHPATLAGMRSMMFLAIRFEGRLFGGLNFYSKTPGHYVQEDALVARRIADHVALALSHARLAEHLRRSEALRARTTNIELLDELLAALIAGRDLRDLFERISTIARKVLPHDAAFLMIRLADGARARVYAGSGMPATLPEVTKVPRELLDNENWEHDIIDDLALFTRTNYAQLTDAGLRSLLRVPIRLDGQFAGALVFLSKASAAFKSADIMIARRMADRMAVTLASTRELEASKRADEATARASRLEDRVRALTEELDARTGYRRVVGESAVWRQVLTQATQVAATEATVLLLGESGTGKEVVARFMHRGSRRSNGPFVALNCAALPEQLLEAELFGYERGAYTGATQSKPGQLEQAAGGTLFLDEVAEMSPTAQAKFLRVLQEREFQRLGATRVLRTDARVVAATNRDLQKAMANGQFREDLYYRLNVFAIGLPPLRNRSDDVMPLSEAFLADIGRGLGRPPGGISREARRLLIEYHWPGNVRELRNILERAAILCDGGLITPEHLALVAPPPSRVAPAIVPEVTGSAAKGDLNSVERSMIQQALEAARFNKSKAAKSLGLTRHQLYIRMRKHGFE